MLTASPSPRLNPAPEGSLFPSPRGPAAAAAAHRRTGSSKAASPIVKPHSAHVCAAESSRYPTSAPSNQPPVYQSTHGSPQCSPTESTVLQQQQPPPPPPPPSSSCSASVRSRGTQTSPIGRPSERRTTEAPANVRAAALMVDAQTQYSPPDSDPQPVKSSTPTPTSPISKLKIREQSTTPSEPPVPPSAGPDSVKSTLALDPPPPTAHAAAATNPRSIPYDPVVDAAMPAGPSAAVATANAAETSRTERQRESTIGKTATPTSSKRNHSVTDATQALSLQNDPSPSSKRNSLQAPSTKKMRPEDPEVKVMPADYSLASTRDLVLLISSMLMELIRYNDTIPLHNNQLTRFHSRAPPGISVVDYLQRLTTHATLSPPILLSMVFYIDKLCALYPAFTISSLTVHRFLITAATVASKGLSDSFWTNKTYARVGGVSVRELALLELEFLVRVQWRIVPQPEVLVDYYRSLVRRTAGYTMEGVEQTEDGGREGSNGTDARRLDAG